MKIVRRAAVLLLLSIALCGLFAPQIAPYAPDRQFRETPDAPPGAVFRMGTDEIGRDRFSRLIYATRISALMAPVAAFCSIALALLISSLASAGQRAATLAVSGFTTVCLSLPWIFLFIVLRAALPLNASPAASVALTFGLMGVAGWAWPARVFTASILEIRESSWLMQARAAGVPAWRIAVTHAWPHLRTLAAAQFRILIPAYILSEASLGLIGLGVPDPLPSWGNLLRDLQHPDIVRANPWVLAPLGLLVIVMICMETLEPGQEATL
jgi:peptide/nickel transport system permease protein